MPTGSYVVLLLQKLITYSYVLQDFASAYTGMIREKAGEKPAAEHEDCIG